MAHSWGPHIRYPAYQIVKVHNNSSITAMSNNENTFMVGGHYNMNYKRVTALGKVITTTLERALQNRETSQRDFLRCVSGELILKRLLLTQAPNPSYDGLSILSH